MSPRMGLGTGEPPTCGALARRYQLRRKPIGTFLSVNRLTHEDRKPPRRQPAQHDAGPVLESTDLAFSSGVRAHTRTPLQELTIRVAGSRHSLWLKLEAHNPTGSIKYRTAVGLVEALDTAQPLIPGTRVVESTSGNLGVALAKVLAEFDCQLVAVVDPKVPASTRAAIAAEGGELVSVDRMDTKGGYLLTRLAKVDELRKSDSDLRWADQYNCPANPRVHRDTTAVEILRQTGGLVDAVLVAVSTGGTLAGISEGVRGVAPGARIYAVDVHGSYIFSDRSEPHLLTGIGATRKSTFLRRHHYHRALTTPDVDAVAICRMLFDDTGLAVGGSSGAVIAAFIAALGSEMSGNRRPVAVLPDGGANYFATVYNDEWLADCGALDRVRGAESAARLKGLRFDLSPATRSVFNGPF